MAGWSHKPHGGAAVLTQILRQVNMPEYAMVAVDEQILLYVNLVGACERISRTAIPQAYTRWVCLAAALARWEAFGLGGLLILARSFAGLLFFLLIFAKCVVALALGVLM